MVDFIIIALCAVLIFTPCVMTLCNRNSDIRRKLTRADCFRPWVICCQRLRGRECVDDMERGDGGPVATFDCMQTARAHQQSSANSLELTAWRADVARRASLTDHLGLIKSKTQETERDPPALIVASGLRGERAPAPTHGAQIDREDGQRQDDSSTH